VNTTSWADTGVPSENVMSSRSLAVHVRPSGEAVGSPEASAGFNASWASRDTRPSKIFAAPSGA
jgi:hypothetical protein